MADRRLLMIALAGAALCISSCGTQSARDAATPVSAAVLPTLAATQEPTMAVSPTKPAATAPLEVPTTPSAPTNAPAPTDPPAATEPTMRLAATLQPEDTVVSQKQPTGAAAGPTTPAAQAPVDPSLAAFVDQAKADLAQRQGSAPAAIIVLEVRSVTWPDPGLGCPQPGMVYKQVPVDGLLIRLSLNGQEFHYHSGGSKAPFLCDSQGA